MTITRPEAGPRAGTIRMPRQIPSGAMAPSVTPLRPDVRRGGVPVASATIAREEAAA